jgi:hypothetical protein
MELFEDLKDFCPKVVKCKDAGAFSNELRIGSTYRVISVTYLVKDDVWSVKVVNNKDEAKDYTSLLFTPVK